MANLDDLGVLPGDAPTRGEGPGSSPPGEKPIRFTRRGGVRTGFAIALALLMMLPALVAIAVMAGRPWYAVDDFGITDLRVRDVWSWNTPLTGPWSRFGWNHPGPAMFWLRSVVLKVGGGAPWTIRTGGAAIQVAAIGWLAWVTARRDLRMLLAAATVSALSYLAFGAYLFRQPWEPNVVIPLLILFIFLTCIVAAGSFRQFIAMTIVGSVIVQTQVGYGLLIAAGFAWAIVFTLLDARRERVPPERWRSTLLITGVVSLVLWTLPLIDTIVNWPGNLEKLAAYFSAGGHETVGLGRGAGIIAAEFRWIPPWLGGEQHIEPTTISALPSSLTLLMIPVALVALGFLAARRTGSRSDARMVGLAALLLVVGVVSVTNADAPRPYTFQWRAVIVAFVVVACVWAIAAAFEGRAGRAVRIAIVGLLVGAIGFGTIEPSVSVATASNYAGLEALGPVLRDLVAQLHRDGHLRRRVVLLKHEGTAVHSIYAGLVDQLDRHGVAVRVEPSEGRVYGAQRVGRSADAGETWYVSTDGSYARELRSQPGARVAASHPLTPSESTELAELRARLADELVDAGRGDLRSTLGTALVAFAIGRVVGIDKAAASRVAQLNVKVIQSGDCQCAIVIAPRSREVGGGGSSRQP